MSSLIPTPARNKGPVVPVDPRDVDAMIRLAARTYPDHEMVCAADATLTYAQAAPLINVVARQLLAAGVSTGDRVVVVAQRGAMLAVAAAAVVRAGAVYTPIDPGNPAERQAYIVGDAQPVAVVTVCGATLACPVPAGIPVVDADLEQVRAAAADETLSKDIDAGELSRPIEPDDGSYLIYTSGTTGTPKGVLNTHIGAAAHLQWFGRAFAPAKDLRWMQKAPVGFDVSVAEIFGCITTGGCVVMPPADWWPGDVDTFVEVINDSRVTVLSMVPSLMRVVADVLEDFGDSLSVLKTLRFLLLGGEAVPGDLAQRCLDEIGCRILGLYGPTEAAMDVTCVEYTADNALAATEGCLLGDPEDNVIVHVLDDNGQEITDGAVGELFLAGVQLAAGYVNDEEKTAAAFVASPFDGDGGRMYATGDLVRWNEDGRLVFVGRKDDQVKVRGNRLTLGEVEVKLAKVAGVKACAAVADTSGEETVLRAAIVADADAADVDPARIRQDLSELVPSYMVPTTITVVESLPVTANGKLDRRELLTITTSH